MLGWFKKKDITVITPQEGYDLWASTYSKESNPIKNLSDKLIEQMLPALSGKSILDAGCGTGHFCVLAEKNRASRIIGVDFSQAMIDEAKKNCPTADFQCADLSSLKFEKESMDVAICALVIGHIENITPALANLSHSLKIGGLLLLTDFHPVLTLQGAKRTFRNATTGETVEIRHHLHPLEKIKNVLSREGFRVEQLEEPSWKNVPVVYGIRAIKVSHGSVA